jgi:hypothetical protein
MVHKGSAVHREIKDLLDHKEQPEGQVQVE